MLYYLVVINSCDEDEHRAFLLDSLNKDTAINDACDIVASEGYMDVDSFGNMQLDCMKDYHLLEVKERTDLHLFLIKRIEADELEDERVEYERLKKKFG